MTLKEQIAAFLRSGSGYGYGDGSGSGSGYGDGSGSGYGSGSGSGYGDGDGDGDGDGSGNGSGFGDGDGYGYGNGSGFGDGDGYGYGIKTFCGETVYCIDGVNTIIRSIRGNVASGSIVNGDLTTERCFVVKQDNTFAHGKTLRAAMDALRDKLFEDMPEEELISAFLAETKTGSLYSVQHFYDWHHRLTGSCEMGRKSFARDNEIDIENGKMTLEEFLNLTKNAYGGDIIRRVAERLEGQT